MSKIKNQFLVETDVLISHLTTKGTQKSPLEKLMECGICFTTVINSAEIYFALRNNEEKTVINSLMNSVKVLGFSSRYSLSVDKFIGKVNSVRDALICSTAEINKLVIVTHDIIRYKAVELEVKKPEKL